MGAGASTSAPEFPTASPSEMLKMLESEENTALFNYVEPEDLSTLTEGLELENVRKGTKLNLSELDLGEPPPGVSALDKLLSLDVSSNQFTLTSLLPLLAPKNFLMQLCLSSNPTMFNPLPHLPITLGCSGLLHLDVSFTDITLSTLSSLLESLEQLLRLDCEVRADQRRGSQVVATSSTHQLINSSAHQLISSSAHQLISLSAYQLISSSAH